MMKCNINRKGRMVRFYSGLFDLVIAVGIGLVTLVGMIESWGYIAAGILGMIGLFTLFEAMKGWCVLRAMGVRTPL
ncbi:hypothetical protein JD969_19825 [Planctomycetota bacterium]|nr:hypothetical protein JD969_19825 [Planctomycetota bacterium]